jgi:hypothetical protein
VLERAAMLRAATLRLIALAATGSNNIDLEAALEALAEVIEKYRAGKPLNQVNPPVSARVRKNGG